MTSCSAQQSTTQQQGAMQSTNESIAGIADIVAKAFTEIKEDMDRIVNSADMSSPTAKALLAAAAGTDASMSQQPVQPEAVEGSSSHDGTTNVPLQLGHGRTHSESPGYDDYVLPNPLQKMPEAVQDISAAAEGSAGGISLSQRFATSFSAPTADGVSAQQLADGADVPTASGPCMEFATDSPASYSEGTEVALAAGVTAGGAAAATGVEVQQGRSDGVAESYLSYTELLERALGGMDPKLQQMCGNNTTSSSSSRRVSAENRRLSGGEYRRSTSSSGGSPSSYAKQASYANRTSRPGSGNAAPAASQQDRVQSLTKRPWQVQSKFPAAAAGAGAGAGGARRALARSSDDEGSLDGSAAAVGSLRIFKQGSGAALKLLEMEEHTAFAATAGGGGSVRSSINKQLRSSTRSKSAPRETAAVARHVKRMSHSPGRPSSAGTAPAAQEQSPGQAGAQAAAAAAGQPGRSKSNPRYTKGYIERLYAMGVEKQHKRAQPPEREGASPVRLTEDEWRRVTLRLYNDARNKADRMRMRCEHADAARDEAMTATCHTLGDRLHSGMAAAHSHGSSGGGKAPSGGGAVEPPSALFYERQMALLQRRAQRSAEKRPSDEDDLKECTFHPEINPVSRHMVPHRSVVDMQKWEMHRQLHVYEMALDKGDHEFDGYTFVPKINDSSRRIALASYAAAPDPARPWTSSPVHTSAPPRQVSPPRQISPPRALMSSYPYPGAEAVDFQQLRHSIAGPHFGSPASAGAAVGRTNYSSPGVPFMQPQELHPASAPAGAPRALALEQSMDSSLQAAARKLHFGAIDNFTAWEQKQEEQQGQTGAAALPPGVVIGVPVFDGGASAAQVGVRPSQASPGQIAEDAVVIQMPEGSSNSRKTMFTVAPGDGVAFVSLGAVRTSNVGPGMAVPVTPAQAQAGLEAGLAGNREWRAPAGSSPAVLRDDSAANTPTKRQMAATAADRLTSAAARAFRDDSAGGMHTQVRKISSGGSYFCPVTSAQKASPLSKLQQEVGGKLQPTLSDATRAALELSQQLGLGLRETSESQRQQAVAAAAAAAGQQPVLAYYMAVETRRRSSSSNSYSQMYSSSKAAAAAKAGKGMEGLYTLGQGSAGGAEASWDTELDPTEARMQEWQQQQQQAAAGGAPGLQKQYSAAQLLNAKHRSISSGGRGPVLEAGTAPASEASLTGLAGSASELGLQSSGFELLQQILGGINNQKSAQLLPAAGDSALGNDCSHLQQLLAHKAEGMLDQTTQSVPFELMASPRARLYLSSNSGVGSVGGVASPRVQQLLALLGKAEEGAGCQVPAAITAAVAAAAAAMDEEESGRAAVNQQQQEQQQQEHGQQQGSAGSSQMMMVHNLLRPAAGSPYLPDSRLNSPACGNSCVPMPHGSSHNLLLQRGMLASHGSSKLSAASRACRSGNSSSGTAWPCEPTDSAAAVAAHAKESSALTEEEVVAFCSATNASGPAPATLADAAQGEAMESEVTAEQAEGEGEEAAQPASEPEAAAPAEEDMPPAEAAEPQLAVAAVTGSASAAPPAAGPAAEVDGESVSAEQLLGMLFDPTMSPKDKARMMATTFKKTMSRHNIPLNALEATLAALPAAAAAAAAGSAPASPNAAVGAPVGPVPTASSTAAAAVPAFPAAVEVDPAADTLESDNMQELLGRLGVSTEHLQGQHNWPANSGGNSPAARSPSSRSAAVEDTLGGASGPKGVAAAQQQGAGGLGLVVNSGSMNSRSVGGGAEIFSRLSYAAAAAAAASPVSTSGGSGGSSSGGGSTPTRAVCRITQFATGSQLEQ